MSLILVKEQCLKHNKKNPIQSILILDFHSLIIFFANQYVIYDIETQIVVCEHDLALPISCCIYNQQSHKILACIKDKKDFYSIDPYTNNWTILYDFKKQLSKYHIQVEPSILLQQFSGYFCLLRKYHNETLVVIYSNKQQRIRQFYINQQCLSTFDHQYLLVNYRQIMKKNVLEIALIQLNGNHPNKFVNVNYQDSQKGIVLFVGKHNNNNALIAVNGKSYPTISLINIITGQLLNRIIRDKYFLEVSLISKKPIKYLINEYLLNQQTRTYYTILNQQTLQNQQIIEQSNNGQYKFISINNKLWLNYRENWQKSTSTIIKLYKIITKSTMLMHICNQYLQQRSQSQIINIVYDLLN